MAIRVKINIDWAKVKQQLIEQIDTRVIFAFQNACDDAVNYAKTNHGYTQQSGALNSSTGYQLYKDGSLIHSRFEASQGGSDSDGARAKGVAAGEKAASERASQLGAHICAVIVAGMPYAIYVESKGYDVLSATEKQFPDFLQKRMDEAFKNENVPYSITTG
ncbi:MAG: hypothetical protein LBR97_04665 [Dysgonamonadaceae bacterium]|jgi:hypothetical protein|nr:hypothetical protein [Dysgonamonadaceae bacterium]